jgi:diguanylate cyclase (GGDEF)-like protein
VVRAHGGKSAEPARDALAWAGAAGLAASLVLAAAAWFGVRRLGTDLQMLASAAERIGTSDARERIPLGRSSREVLTLSHALARMTDRLIDLQASLEEQVAARTAQLEAANTALEKLARRDALTGVLNRRGFEPKAQLLFDLALRGGRPLCLCLVDADHFKTVNDTYGHAVGDEVLKAIAGCLASRMRRTDLLARWGGEEFVLMLPDTSIDMASDLADALRKTIAAFEQLLPARVTVSIGLAQLKGTDESIAALLDRADRALYAAKNGGRDQVSTLASLL